MQVWQAYIHDHQALFLVGSAALSLIGVGLVIEWWMSQNPSPEDFMKQIADQEAEAVKAMEPGEHPAWQKLMHDIRLPIDAPYDPQMDVTHHLKRAVEILVQHPDCTADATLMRHLRLHLPK